MEKGKEKAPIYRRSHRRQRDDRPLRVVLRFAEACQRATFDRQMNEISVKQVVEATGEGFTAQEFTLMVERPRFHPNPEQVKKHLLPCGY